MKVCLYGHVIAWVPWVYVEYIIWKNKVNTPCHFICLQSWQVLCLNMVFAKLISLCTGLSAKVFSVEVKMWSECPEWIAQQCHYPRPVLLSLLLCNVTASQESTESGTECPPSIILWQSTMFKRELMSVKLTPLVYRDQLTKWCKWDFPPLMFHRIFWIAE